MALLVVDFLKAPIGIDLIPDKKISCAGPGIVDRRSSGIIPLVIDWPVVMSKTSQFALKHGPNILNPISHIASEIPYDVIVACFRDFQNDLCGPREVKRASN